MSTLLSILDFVVLLLIVLLAIRTVGKGSTQDSGSMTLSIFIALAAIVFATVSFAAYMGLVAASSSLTRVIFLVVLLVMAGLMSEAASSKPAA